MTEPPEPRDSTEGGGDEDYDAIWENADADEIMSGLEDDALLDSIAQGVHGDLGPDQLTELLSGLRDEPDATDIPMKNTARVERGENVLEPPGPRRTSEGTPAPMAISDDAQRIRVVADSQSAQGAIQLANTNLGEVQINADRLTDAVGVLQEAAAGIANDANTAASAAGSGDDEMALRGAGEQARQAFETAMAAAEAARLLCDQAVTAVQQAVQSCGDAAAADQQFRQTCSDVAGRHGA